MFQILQYSDDAGKLYFYFKTLRKHFLKTFMIKELRS